MTTTVGLLHPGSMGAAFGAQLRTRGITVLWCPDGRSEASRLRAERAGLEPVHLTSLLVRSDLVLCLCPPAAAEQVAQQVADHGFSGKTYIEANAITPRRTAFIAERLRDATVLDAAVVGSPPLGGKFPTLYLSGPGTQAAQVEDLFVGTDVRTRLLGTEIGKASALKLAYSSYQKVSRVLAALAYGAADAHGVADELLTIAEKRTSSYLTETDYIPKTVARAWRWAPELEDAAQLLAETGLPDTVVRAAAETLARWGDDKDARLDVGETLKALRGEPEPRRGTG